MNINATKRAFLKIQFRTDMAQIRISRSTAASLYRQGRKLRQKAGADSTNRGALEIKLYNKGCRLHDQADSIRSRTPSGNGRMLTLALAYLNGTPYIRCEGENTKTTPSLKHLTETLKDCFPKDLQDGVEGFIQAWLEHKDPQELAKDLQARLDAKKMQAELVELHKKETEIKRGATWVAKRIQQAQAMLQDAKARDLAEKKTLEEIQARRLELQAKLGAE